MNGALSMTKDDLEQAYRVHDGALAGHQGADAVVVGADGITVLATANPTGDGDHTWVLHLNLDGAVTWERHYDRKYGVGRAIAGVAGGGFAIAGEVQRSPTAYQASLLHIDAAGEILHATALGPRGITGFNSIQARADGTLVVAGSAAGRGWLVTTGPTLGNPTERALATEDINAIGLLPSGDIVALGALEKSTTGFGRARVSSFFSPAVSHAPGGEARWQVTLPRSGRGDPSALVVHEDDLLIVGTGAVAEHEPAHVWLAMIDAAGHIIRESTIAAASASAQGWAAVALADSYAIAGEIAPGDGRRTPHVWRLHEDGTPWWDHSYQAPGSGEAFEILNGIAALPDGGLVIVGSTSRGAGKSNAWIVRLAPEGTVIWQRVFGSAATGS